MTFFTRTSKLYIPSKWTPPRHDIPPTIDDRIDTFAVHVKQLFQRKLTTQNISSYHNRLLTQLANSTTLLFPDTDKGLGPCAVTYDQYVTDCLLHLNDTSTYMRLTKEEAIAQTTQLFTAINTWLTTYRPHIDPMDRKYISHHLQNSKQQPYGQFYITYKVHKGMANNLWPTRPVCSDPSSLPHSLGKWVNQMLKPVTSAQPSHFKDSFALNHSLQHIFHRVHSFSPATLNPCTPTSPPNQH